MAPERGGSDATSSLTDLGPGKRTPSGQNARASYPNRMTSSHGQTPCSARYLAAYHRRPHSNDRRSRVATTRACLAAC